MDKTTRPLIASREIQLELDDRTAPRNTQLERALKQNTYDLAGKNGIARTEPYSVDRRRQRRGTEQVLSSSRREVAMPYRGQCDSEQTLLHDKGAERPSRYNFREA